jgi:hypothetical protein
MIQELLCFITDAVPAWLFFDEPMKAVAELEFVVKTVGGNGERLTFRRDFP